MSSSALSTPSLANMLQKLAPKIGATVHLHPEWPMVGKIIFRNGRTSYFRQNVFDLNPLGATSICKDKDFATYFLQQQGYPVIPNSRAFYSQQYQDTYRIDDRGIDQACSYATSIGFPVVVKPNDGSQGVGVSVANDVQELRLDLESIFAHYPIAIVQSMVAGNDYRVVVLDGEIMTAYHRIPLNIIGDGRSTVEELFDHKLQQLQHTGRKPNVSLSSRRVVEKLAHQGFEASSVIANGKQVFLLDNANLSAGGDAVDVAHQVHPEFAQICRQITKDMGLRYCGVDLMIKGDISQSPQDWWVIEVNGAPGLSHFARVGPDQMQKVEEIYMRVLTRLEQGQPIEIMPSVLPTPLDEDISTPSYDPRPV